jgi:hypothetical protein
MQLCLSTTTLSEGQQQAEMQHLRKQVMEDERQKQVYQGMASFLVVAPLQNSQYASCNVYMYPQIPCRSLAYPNSCTGAELANHRRHRRGAFKVWKFGLLTKTMTVWKRCSWLPPPSSSHNSDWLDSGWIRRQVLLTDCFGPPLRLP